MSEVVGAKLKVGRVVDVADHIIDLPAAGASCEDTVALEVLFAGVANGNAGD